jgi:hypothetical protein
MPYSLRLATISSVALLLLYWAFVLVMRSFGAELPDPANLLPNAWRHYVP